VETELPRKPSYFRKDKPGIYSNGGHSHDDDMELVMMPFCRKAGRLTGRRSIFRRGKETKGLKEWGIPVWCKGEYLSAEWILRKDKPEKK